MHAKIIPTRRPYRTVRSTSLVLWRALTAPPLLFVTLSEKRKMLRNRDSFSLLSDSTNFVWRRRNMTSCDVNACERQYFFTTLTRSNSSSALIPWRIGKPKSAPESAHFFLTSQLKKFCVTTFQNGGRRRYRRRTPFSKMNKTFPNHTFRSKRAPRADMKIFFAKFGNNSGKFNPWGVRNKRHIPGNYLG